MPGELADRTEAPTPRRLSEARERGQVARSPDLTAALVLVGGLVVLSWLGPRMCDVLIGFAARQLQAGPEMLDAEASRAALPLLARAAAEAGLPVLAAVACVGVVANLTQVGLLITTHPLTPSLDRLSPLRGLTRLVSARSLVQTLMNLLKLFIVGVLAFQAVRAEAGVVARAVNVSGAVQLGLFAEVVYRVALRLALALLIIAILDYVWQRIRHTRDLRMTKEEVKEEMRRMEGDPFIRQRRRQLQLQLALQRLRRDVPKADVIITNPTEIAIAIQYDAETMRAPKVVAKGRGYVAERIREIAAEHRIPIIERKPLARALFKAVEVGEEIHEQFYKAVAEILAYVYELAHGRARRRAVGA